VAELARHPRMVPEQQGAPTTFCSGTQVRLYDRLAPLLARLESALKLPVGMSLLAVARATPTSGVER
jgi:hypothetical protein